MNHKAAVRAEIKDAAEGRVRAVVATMGVVDKDGDLIEAGAFGRQDVVVSAFNHESWKTSTPVGRGTVTEDGNRAVADLEFFMDTDAGRDTFRTMKHLGELGEWSFGFDVLKDAEPTPEQRERGARRVIRSFDVHEVSPVLRGAGVGTRTVSAKCSSCGAKERRALTPQEKGEVQDIAQQLKVRSAVAGTTRALRPDASWPPADDVVELAEFAAYLGNMLAGLRKETRPPRVRWFKRDFRTLGYAREPEHEIFLSEHLRGRQLIETALHESYHLNQPYMQAIGSEGDAERFAKTWAPAVEAAAQAQLGPGPMRVRLRDGTPHWHGHERGDVVISRTNKHAYRFRGMNGRPRWGKLS